MPYILLYTYIYIYIYTFGCGCGCGDGDGDCKLSAGLNGRDKSGERSFAFLLPDSKKQTHKRTITTIDANLLLSASRGVHYIHVIGRWNQLFDVRLPPGSKLSSTDGDGHSLGGKSEDSAAILKRDDAVFKASFIVKHKLKRQLTINFVKAAKNEVNAQQKITNLRRISADCYQA